MIYEVYIISSESGMAYVDKTYRKIHLGVSNQLVGGLLHVVFTMFDKEMEIGNLKSMTTKDYKLIYLTQKEFLFVTLVDIQLDENKIQAMLIRLASEFQEEYKDLSDGDWSGDITYFYPFIPKMDSIVIETIAGIFFENYPADIVALTNFITENYTLEYQELIGKGLAGKILTERFGGTIKKKNLKKELSKFTVIQELTEDFIKLSVCPFCRKKQSTEPICNFVVGFINGMLKADNWVEKTCVGRGDDYCTFYSVR